MRSEAHYKSMRCLAFFYWFPTLVITFYFSFGFTVAKAWGVIALAVIVLMGFFFSWKLSGMEFISWYHEIVMCGTDKIAMSISILSNGDQSRSWWHPVFEAYFGLLIKFVNPICILFFLFEALKADLVEPFGIVTSGWLPIVASMFVVVAIFIIFAPMIICNYPELFKHNVEKEFSADDIFEKKLKKKANLNATGDKVAEDPSKIELMPADKGTDGDMKVEDA